MKTRAAVGFVTVVLSAGMMLAAASPASANAANPVACRNGGWRTLVSDSGSAFRNQGECVSYATHVGAQIFQPVVAVSPSIVADPYTDFTTTGTGFHANDTVTFTASVANGVIGSLLGATDSSGTASLFARISGGPGCPGGFIADGSTFTMTVTDTSGVHASAAATLATGCGTP